MYMQQRFMPKAAQHHKRQSKTSDQMEQQQKIMKYMMLMMGLLFYNAPSGLNLYIMSSTFFGVIEQWRIRQHIKAEEAKGTLPPSSKPKPPEGPKKLNWIEKLAKKAEEAQRLQSKRPGRRRA
jgi:membrane protein insertase Oxa1/YidC/SpoIIIJ